MTIVCALALNITGKTQARDPRLLRVGFLLCTIWVQQSFMTSLRKGLEPC